MRTPRSVVVALVVALVGALSVGEVAAAGDSSLSEQQWRKKANGVCRRASARIDVAAEHAFGDLPRDEQPSIADISAYVTTVAPIVRGLVREIAALREPEELEPKVRRFVRTARRELARLVDEPSIGLEGNPLSGMVLRADALGLKACT